MSDIKNPRYPNCMIRAKDLKLADVINIGTLGSAGFRTGIVKEVRADSLAIFRPYGTTAGFSWGSADEKQVICYVGIEEYTIPRDDVEYYVYSREDLK